MRIAILSPSPADLGTEITAAIQRAEMEVLDFSWDQPVDSWKKADAFVLLADTAAALTETDLEALLCTLKAQNAKGKPILGLGLGGAKLLIESGLVPGLYKNMVGLSLVEKTPAHGAPKAAWIGLSEDYQYNAFTQNLAPRTFLPAEQRTSAQFIIPKGLLAEIKAQGLNVFIYCDADGRFLSGEPIAALSNKAGTVMALLPHPEYFPAGDTLFHSLRSHLASGYIEQVEPLYYWPRK